MKEKMSYNIGYRPKPFQWVTITAIIAQGTDTNPTEIDLYKVPPGFQLHIKRLGVLIPELYAQYDNATEFMNWVKNARLKILISGREEPYAIIIDQSAGTTEQSLSGIHWNIASNEPSEFEALLLQNEVLTIRFYSKDTTYKSVACVVRMDGILESLLPIGEKKS